MPRTRLIGIETYFTVTFSSLICIVKMNVRSLRDDAGMLSLGVFSPPPPFYPPSPFLPPPFFSTNGFNFF